MEQINVRHLAGLVYAKFFWLVSLGRIRGRAFILRRPALLKVESGAKLIVGRSTYVDKYSRIVVKANLEVGDNVYIGKNSTLIAYSKISIAENTLIAENVSIHTENHGPNFDRASFTHAPITIGRNVWIGAGVVILKGVTIGDGATIGANAVVTKSIPPGATAVGVPAHVVSAPDS